jgi:hypothetical protein
LKGSPEVGKGKVKKSICMFLLSFLILAGCASPGGEVILTNVPPMSTSGVSTATPSHSILSTRHINNTITPTITSTRVPTLTGTPVPSLTAHSWNPQDILVEYGGYGGDGGSSYGDLLPSQFTLLSTGELFIQNWDDETHSVSIDSVALPRAEVCNLLNSIDQAGFLYYDPMSFVKDPDHWNSPIEGAGYGYININSWSDRHVTQYGLFTYIMEGVHIKEIWAEDCGECSFVEFPTILPALSNTYSLLCSYRPAGMQVYQPDRLGIWIDVMGNYDGGHTWPLLIPRLSDINIRNISANYYDFSNLVPDLILSGEDARLVFDLLDQRINEDGVVFTEGTKGYIAFVRPLLPNEFRTSLASLVDSLKCSPEDGWVIIP